MLKSNRITGTECTELLQCRCTGCGVSIESDSAHQTHCLAAVSPAEQKGGFESGLRREGGLRSASPTHGVVVSPQNLLVRRVSPVKSFEASKGKPCRFWNIGKYPTYWVSFLLQVKKCSAFPSVFSRSLGLANLQATG